MGLFQDIRASRIPALAFVAMGMVWAAFAAQVPVIKAQIGANDAMFGLSFMVSSLGAVAAMWLAPVVDARLKDLSLMATTALMAISFVLAGVSGTVVIFTLVMFLAAMTSGVGDILMNARVAEIESSTARPLMNLNHAIFSFAYAGCALLTGFAREAGAGPIPIFGTVCAVIFGLCLFMRITPAAQEERTPGRVGGAASGLVWLGGIVVLAAFFAEQSAEGWSALHLERTLGGSAAQGALGPAILGLSMGFGRLFGQIIASRVRDTVMIAGASLISAFGLALAAFSPTLALAYLGFGVLGAGVSVLVPLAMALVGRVVPASDRVAAIGRASVVGYGAFIFGPTLIGVTSDSYGLPAAFLVVSASLVMVAVILVPLITRRLAASG
ncbi:MAG: MFS transporter [Sedimentitalea sp.]